MKFATILQNNVLARLWRSVAFMMRGIKVSPNAHLLGETRNISIGAGSSIRSGTRLWAGPDGRVEIGDRVWLSADVEIEAVGTVRIGAETTVQRRSTINGNVVLGTECILAPNVFISSGTHPFRAAPDLSIREQERMIAAGRLADPGIDRPVVIGDDCWLGVNAVVCPGVTIGTGAVVGANAVVTRDVPAYAVVAGSPARQIGSRRAAS